LILPARKWFAPFAADVEINKQNYGVTSVCRNVRRILVRWPMPLAA